MDKKNINIKIKDGQIPVVIPESMVIFAAHPDDELLSTGGTILKYAELGTKITVIIVTGGHGGYSREEYKKDIIEKRKHEFIAVAKHLHCDFIELGYDEIFVNRKIISQFTKLIREIRPQVIFMPHPTDDHRTHRYLAEIVQESIYHTATGKAYGGYGKEFMPLAVYCYESPSCKFQYIDASVFVTVDISNYWKKKIGIFNEVYASQIEVLDRVSIWAERTAKLRGNEAHCDYGECFIPYTEYVPLKILLK
ncbi:MAG: PIG-L family deacetylase [archaeon]|nr:PIG-L family deacetylase [archaeon]